MKKGETLLFINVCLDFIMQMSYQLAIVAEDSTENMLRQKEDCLQEVAPSEEHTIALERIFSVIGEIPEELERGGGSGLRAARDTWVANMSIIGYE